MSELKPCPFCGVDPNVTSKDIIGYPVRVGCKNINCRLGQITGTFTIAAWNTRHIPEGYALVPVDPAGEMIAYGAEALKWQDYDTDAESCYRAMIKAAQEHNEC